MTPSSPSPAPRRRSPSVAPATAGPLPAALYHTLFACSPVATLLEDATGRILELNAAACEAFGYPREALLGQNIRRLVPPEDHDRVAENLQQLLAGEVLVHDVWAVRQNGSRLPVELHEQRITLPDGAFGILALAHDITARREAQRALRQAKEQFQALFLASPLPIVVLDREANVRLWSPAAEDMFGWSADEVVGLESPVVSEEQRPELQGKLERVLAGETLRGTEPSQRLRKDQSLVNVLISAAPMHELDGTVGGVIVVYTDLTEKTQLEARLLQAQRLESVGHLASGITHDLNNLLTPVLMAAPVLRSELTSRESLAMLNLVETSALRGADIVRQLLSFASGARVDRVPVQTRHLLRETAEGIRATFPETIQLKTFFPRDLWLVAGNSTQLHQVLMNLCLNARDAMPDGGTLTLTAENLRVPPALARQIPNGRPGPHVVWRVGDTGQGISPEDLARIFDPFFTTKEAGKGTGLGLANVNGIVRFHDGFIQVQSTPGAGTLFKVFLPAVLDSLPPVEASPSALAHGRGEWILVADDEPCVRELFGTILTQHGYQVVLAVDGHEALTLAEQHRGQLALVLTDLLMPRVNGMQLLRSLHRTQPHLKAIAMTGLPHDGALTELAPLGVHHLLRKPCDIPTLLNVLRASLDEAPPGS